MAAQTALIRLGFDPGTADGMIGFGTRKALRAWQRREGLPADGYLSPQMVQRLAAAGARA
jgi:peptidoglycan hydrolase-like protein with peptidoglycan-binding domain